MAKGSATKKSCVPCTDRWGKCAGNIFQTGACFVFTGSNPLARELGVPVKNSTPLFNGKIPCRLLELDTGV